LAAVRPAEVPAIARLAAPSGSIESAGRQCEKSQPGAHRRGDAAKTAIETGGSRA